MKDKPIRVTLNHRSQEQLLAVMDYYKITNPTHMVQTMITQLHNSLNQSQPIEDNNGHSEKESLSNLQ